MHGPSSSSVRPTTHASAGTEQSPSAKQEDAAAVSGVNRGYHGRPGQG